MDPEDSDQGLAGSCQHLDYVRMVAKTFCPRTTTTIETTETETKETIETKVVTFKNVVTNDVLFGVVTNCDVELVCDVVE